MGSASDDHEDGLGSGTRMYKYSNRASAVWAERKVEGREGEEFFFTVVIVRPWTINVEMLAMCQIKLDVR